MIPDQQKKIICDDAFASKVRSIRECLRRGLITDARWGEVLLVLRTWLTVTLALDTLSGDPLSVHLGGLDAALVSSDALAAVCCMAAEAAPDLNLTKEATTAAISADEGAMADMDAILAA